jgi:hypothetical protein
MSLLVYFFRLVSWLCFATFVGLVFWGLVGLVGMLLEPPRGGGRS